MIRLARQGLPHPELDVALVAVGWGRHARGRGQWSGLLYISLLPYVALLAALAVPFHAVPERYRLAISLASVVVASALLAADLAVPATPAALIVHRAGRFGPEDLLAVAYLVFVVGLVIGAVALYRMRGAEEPLPEELPPGAERFVELEMALTIAFVVFATFTAFLVFVVMPAVLTPLLAGRPRGTGPLAILDAHGVTVPHLRLMLPWDEVAEVDVALPVPGDRSNLIGFWILPRDRAAIVTRSGLPRWRRRLLSWWLAVCRRALYLPADWLAEPPEVAVSAARRLLMQHRRRAAAAPA